MARRMRKYRQINIDGNIWWWKPETHWVDTGDHVEYPYTNVIIYDPSITRKYYVSTDTEWVGINCTVMPRHVEKYIREELMNKKVEQAS